MVQQTLSARDGADQCNREAMQSRIHSTVAFSRNRAFHPMPSIDARALSLHNGRRSKGFGFNGAPAFAVIRLVIMDC
jgi:hypothetical protein